MAKLGRRFGLINGFAGEIRGKDLEKLERIAGLTVTLDAPVRPQALLPLPTTSRVGSDVRAAVDARDRRQQALERSQAPTIAIVDSGIDKTSEPASAVASRRRSVRRARQRGSLDGRGHGTFVASIAAGSAPATRARHRMRSDRPRCHGRQRRRQDERRDRRGRVDLPEQGGVQHPRRQLLAPLGRCEPLLARPAERGGREAVVQRRGRRGGGRQLRRRGRARAASSTRPAATRS